MTTRVTKTIAEQITNAQQVWAAGVVAIGKNKNDSVERLRQANYLLDQCYNFGNNQSILFKPTLAFELPVRINREETLSYFIGGEISEDSGFALNPWKNVVFDPGFHFSALGDKDVLVMGRCTFTPHTGKDSVADYTFGYRITNDGLRIMLHHSSLKFTDTDQEKYKESDNI